MLALLKPWRVIAELKCANETFREAFESFMADAPEKMRAIVNNIGFFHECSISARQNSTGGVDTIAVACNPTDPDLDPDAVEEPAGEGGGDTDEFENFITEENILRVINKTFSPRELLYAEVAVGIGMDTGVWTKEQYYSMDRDIDSIVGTVAKKNVYTKSINSRVCAHVK
jgi:hypothetical protein